MKTGKDPTSTRFVGLDAWRAGLLILGPVFHAALAGQSFYPATGWMPLITVGVHSFRMEAFFTIAGFLMAYRRGTDTAAWLERRTKQLAIPLFTCWVTVLPLSRLVASWGSERGQVWSPLDPQYLWFLLVLIALTYPAWAAVCASRLDRIARAWERRPSLWFVVPVGAVLAVVLGRYGQHVLPFRFAPGMIVPLALASSPYYGIFFFAGMIAARSPRLMAHLARSRAWVLGPLSLLIYLAVVDGFDAYPGGRAPSDEVSWAMLLHVLDLLLPVPVALGMAYAVMALGIRPLRPNRITTAISDAAFTIYLVHMLPLEILCWLLGARVTAGPFIVIVAGGALAASFLFHRLVVRRSAFMGAAFNGRLPLSATETARRDVRLI